MAAVLGIATRTYTYYETDTRQPAAGLLAVLAKEGWNMDWLLNGRGPEMSVHALEIAGLAEAKEPKPQETKASQGVRPEDVSLAVQLAEEALEGKRLEPSDYGQLVSLIYDALVNGLPSAQVLAFARPAARGLSRGKEDAAQGVGGSGKGAAGQG